MTTRNVELKRATWRRYYANTFMQRADDHPSKQRRKAFYNKWRKAPENAEKLKTYRRRYKLKHKIRTLARLAIARAVAGGIAVDIDFLRSLEGAQPEGCACCGRAFEYEGASRDRQPHWRSPSLDRIVTARGYVRGNVAIICWRCNVLKKDGTLEEILAIARYIGSHTSDG